MRLALDPAQFFPSFGSSPTAGTAFAATFAQAFGQAKSRRGSMLGLMKGASQDFQKGKVSVEQPRPAVMDEVAGKQNASPTRTTRPTQQMGQAVRQRKPMLFGNCGRQADGSYG